MTQVRILPLAQNPRSCHNPLHCIMSVDSFGLPVQCFSYQFQLFLIWPASLPVATCWLFLVHLFSGPSEEPQLLSASCSSDSDTVHVLWLLVDRATWLASWSSCHLFLSHRIFILQLLRKRFQTLAFFNPISFLCIYRREYR